MATNRSDLEVRVSGRDDLSPQFDRIESRLIRFVGAVGASIAAIRITTAPIVAAVELERELANVRKTTNFSANEMERLNSELLTLSTRIDVSAKDLAKIAAAAGQQGLGREGVAGVVAFTESVSRMSSVLDITAEQAAEDIGKIANIFKIPLREIEQAVSTFNEVSNNSTAKGEELLDVVRRIGDAAGTLDLQQSVALAATGLDFGQSPEVVGTAFAKVFSSLTQKAQDFGRLLFKETNGATEKWLTLLESNGLEAFKQVLGALRGLNTVAQQNAIIKLFGGGRIGALLNKLVQDTANTVLDRNFASATEGAKGFSAIQEQATVLNTVSAQAQLTLNTLVKAGIDASAQLLGPLIAYAVRLQEAIKSAEFQSFLNALGAAVNNVLRVVDGFITAVSSLGLVWTNLVPILTAFLGLKLSQAILGMTSSVLGLSAGMKSISKDAKDAGTALQGSAAASAAASKTFSAAWVADRLGYRALYDEIVRVRDAKRALAAADADIAAKQSAYIAAEQARKQSTDAYKPLARARDSALRDERAANARLLQAQQDAANAEAAVQTQRAARIQAAEQQNAKRLAAIEADYQTRRAAIQATGTQTGLKALRAERATALAEEQARHERSLRGVEQYWARRVAATQVGAQAAVAAETAAYTAAQSRLQSASAAAGAAGAARTSAGNDATAARDALTKSRDAANALTAATAAAAAQGAAMGRLGTVWGSVTLIWRTAQGVLGGLAGAMSRLAGIAFGAFAWVGLVYTLADALGLLGPLKNAFDSLAETLGFTSKAKAQAAVQSEVLTQKMREEERAAADLIQAYAALRKGKNAEEVRASLSELLKKSQTEPTAALRQAAFEQFLRAGASIQAAISGTKSGLDEISAKQAEEAKLQVEALRLVLQRAESDLDKYQEKLSKKQDGAIISDNEQAVLDRYATSVNNAKKALDDASVAVRKFDDDQRKLAVNFKEVGKDADAYAKSVRSMFTPESADLFTRYIVKLNEYNEQVRLQLGRAAELAQSKAGKTSQEQAFIDAQISGLKQQADIAAASAVELRKEYDAAFKKVLDTKGLSEAVRNSVRTLKDYLTKFSQFVPFIAAAIRGAPQETLTGANAPNAAPAAEGTKEFDPKVTGQESLARRLGRARLELARAQSAAESNLEKEKNSQLQSISDVAYERGLKSMADYYSERERIQLAGVDAEIKQRLQDVQANQFEAAKPGIDAPERLRLQADLTRLRGEIAVLVARKEGIQLETDKDISAAKKSFDQGVLQTASELSQQGLIPADVVQTFERTLDSLRAAAVDKFAELKREGKTGLAGALDDSFQVTAAQSAIDSVSARFDIAMKDVENARRAIEEMKASGALTTLEAETQLKNLIISATPGLKALADEMQNFLDGIIDVEVRASPAFQKLQQAVLTTRTQVRGLTQEVGETARQINDTITQQLADILVNMRGSVDGIKDAFNQFLRAIGSQIINLAAKNAAEGLMGLITGGDKTGGIGGAIAGLFGGGAKADGSKTAPFYTVPGTPSVEDAILKGADKTGFSLAGLGGQIKDFFSKSDNVFMQTIGNIIGFLGTSFSSLIAAIFTSSATVAAASAGAGAGGLVGLLGGGLAATGFAHTGGIIGSKSLMHKLMSPAIFRDAHRFHSGGVIGLKPNEVPIVGLKGEEVLTEDDPRHRNNLGKGGSSGGGMVNVWVVTPDQQPQVGPNDIVAVVSDNIARGGSIKKLIKQVQIGG